MKVKLSDESPYSIQQFASQLRYDLKVGNGTRGSKAVSGCSYRKVAALTRILSTPFARTLVMETAAKPAQTSL